MQEQLDRIEARQKQILEELARNSAALAAVLDALSEDGEEEGPQYDLDGNLIERGERDQSQSLD